MMSQRKTMVKKYKKSSSNFNNLLKNEKDKMKNTIIMMSGWNLRIKWSFLIQSHTYTYEKGAILK